MFSLLMLDHQKRSTTSSGPGIGSGIFPFLLPTIDTTNFLLLLGRNLQNKRTLRPKSRDYWTDVFPHLSDDWSYDQFRHHFRISRSVFNYLVARLSTHPSFRLSAPNSIPIERQIAIVLTRLAKSKKDFRSMEKQFGVSQGSVSHFTDRFLDAMMDLEAHRIRWPTGDRMIEVQNGFEFPPSGNRRLAGCASAMDGSLIEFMKPPKRRLGARFISGRSGKSSGATMNLLTACDHEERFTFVHCGEAGMPNFLGSAMARLFSDT